jgi:hypothetical protein
MSIERAPATGPLRCDDARRPVAAPPRRHGLQVHYCGGCNPFIDRVAVAQSVQAGLNGDAAGGTLYVSGCPRSCAADHRLSIDDDPATVVVAGEHVDAAPTAAADISTIVIGKLASPTAPPHPDRRPGDHHHTDVAHEG